MPCKILKITQPSPHLQILQIAMMTGQGRAGQGRFLGSLYSQIVVNIVCRMMQNTSVCLFLCPSVNPSYQISHMMQNIPMTGDNAKFTAGDNPPTCSFHIEKIFWTTKGICTFVSKIRCKFNVNDIRTCLLMLEWTADDYWLCWDCRVKLIKIKPSAGEQAIISHDELQKLWDHWKHGLYKINQYTSTIDFVKCVAKAF